jgi:hypothetical protein
MGVSDRDQRHLITRPRAQRRGTHHKRHHAQTLDPQGFPGHDPGRPGILRAGRAGGPPVLGIPGAGARGTSGPRPKTTSGQPAQKYGTNG